MVKRSILQKMAATALGAFKQNPNYPVMVGLNFVSLHKGVILFLSSFTGRQRRVWAGSSFLKRLWSRLCSYWVIAELWTVTKLSIPIVSFCCKQTLRVLIDLNWHIDQDWCQPESGLISDMDHGMDFG